MKQEMDRRTKESLGASHRFDAGIFKKKLQLLDKLFGNDTVSEEVNRDDESVLSLNDLKEKTIKMNSGKPFQHDGALEQMLQRERSPMNSKGHHGTTSKGQESNNKIVKLAPMVDLNISHKGSELFPVFDTKSTRRSTRLSSSEREPLVSTGSTKKQDNDLVQSDHGAGKYQHYSRKEATTRIQNSPRREPPSSTTSNQDRSSQRRDRLTQSEHIPRRTRELLLSDSTQKPYHGLSTSPQREKESRSGSFRSPKRDTDGPRSFKLPKSIKIPLRVPEMNGVADRPTPFRRHSAAGVRESQRKPPRLNSHESLTSQPKRGIEKIKLPTSIKSPLRVPEINGVAERPKPASFRRQSAAGVRDSQRKPPRLNSYESLTSQPKRGIERIELPISIKSPLRALEINGVAGRPRPASIRRLSAGGVRDSQRKPPHLKSHESLTAQPRESKSKLKLIACGSSRHQKSTGDDSGDRMKRKGRSQGDKSKALLKSSESSDDHARRSKRSISLRRTR
jgi:hypothetical protein